MKRKNMIITVLFALLGFALGLAFEGFVGKAYAKTEQPATNITLPEGSTFEIEATGSARSADYEIVYINGRKYIIFSSGGDIEVLEY